MDEVYTKYKETILGDPSILVSPLPFDLKSSPDRTSGYVEVYFIHYNPKTGKREYRPSITAANLILLGDMSPSEVGQWAKAFELAHQLATEIVAPWNSWGIDAMAAWNMARAILYEKHSQIMADFETREGE